MEEDKVDHRPLVSICMPAYNAEKYIMEALDSVFRQSYGNIEVIVVNDGSADKTGQLLDSIHNSRLRVFHTANNGQCAAANMAFRKSKGTLIKFMDADDIISDNFIEDQVNRIGSHNNVIASANWGRFYNDDLSTFNLNTNAIEGDNEPVKWLITALEKNNAMMQCARWLIPRNILDRSGLWDEELSLINDFEFFCRVLLHADKILFTQQALLYYRSGMPNSLSTLKSRKGALSAYNSIYKGTAYLLQKADNSVTRLLVANCFQNYIFTFYPYHPDLTASAEKRVKDLGGANAQFQAGGYTNTVQKIIGWKWTKKIKLLFN